MVFNFLAFSDFEAWKVLIQIFIICGSLLIANFIRCRIGFMRKSLIPNAIIGGAIILIVKAICQYGFNYELIDTTFMETLTYHALGIGFVALSLKTTPKEVKSSRTTVIESGAMTVGGYLAQGIVGLGSCFIIYAIMQYGINNLGWMDTGFKWFGGILLLLGFGQGTGQALNWGIVYTTEYGFVGGDTFGLTIATIGFIVASIGGVIYLNILRKKGIISKEQIEFKEKNTLADYQTDNDIPNTDAMDKLTFQISFVLGVYGITFAFLKSIQTFLIDTDLLGNFGHKTLSPLLWGFNFLFGTLFAFLFKMILKKFKLKKYVKREYINNYFLDRIGGMFFDLMIVAGTAAISFEQVKNHIVPLIIVCSLGTIVTYIYLSYTTKEIYKGYEHEGFLAMFGMLTGTASNGMILLREIDPKFETPMANNLVLQNVPAIIIGFPLLLLIGFAASSMINSIITFIIMIVFFTIILIFLFRRRIFKKYKRTCKETKEKKS